MRDDKSEKSIGWTTEQLPGVTVIGSSITGGPPLVIDHDGAGQFDPQVLAARETADHYVTTQLVLYQPPELTGYTTLPVLPFLWGQPWDQLALNYVHSLRPHGIRVTTGECTDDAVPWRVTVLVDAQHLIQRIEQEVMVGLVGAATGWARRGRRAQDLQHHAAGAGARQDDGA